jgi:hypothetical protein
MSEFLSLLSFTVSLVGIFVTFIPMGIAQKKVTKKLGYGPVVDINRCFGRFYFLYWIQWPREYYDTRKYDDQTIVTMTGTFEEMCPLKPKYKKMVDLWMKEYNKIKKENILYSILGLLLITVGFVGFIAFL